MAPEGLNHQHHMAEFRTGISHAVSKVFWLPCISLQMSGHTFSRKDAESSPSVTQLFYPIYENNTCQWFCFILHWVLKEWTSSIFFWFSFKRDFTSWFYSIGSSFCVRSYSIQNLKLLHTFAPFGVGNLIVEVAIVRFSQETSRNSL